MSPIQQASHSCRQLIKTHTLHSSHFPLQQQSFLTVGYKQQVTFTEISKSSEIINIIFTKEDLNATKKSNPDPSFRVDSKIEECTYGLLTDISVWDGTQLKKKFAEQSSKLNKNKPEMKLKCNCINGYQWLKCWRVSQPCDKLASHPVGVRRAEILFIASC